MTFQHDATTADTLVAPSREAFVPNPEVDQVAAVFWAYQSDESTELSSYRRGAFWLNDTLAYSNRRGDPHITTVSDELELLNSVIDLVLELDPDMIVGWEIQSASWGYLSARAHSYGKYFSHTSNHGAKICRPRHRRTDI